MRRREMLVFGLAAGAAWAADEPGFQPLFDGKTLRGWVLVGGRGPGYLVENEAIVCPKEGGGNLYTEKEYANFIVRMQFRLWEGGTTASEFARRCKGTPPTQAWRSRCLMMKPRSTKKWG